MAHHKSALKRIRQTRTRNYYNRLNKKAMKMAIRAVRESKEYLDGMEKLRIANSILDKVASRGVIHKNYAANRKSSLNAHVKALKPLA